LAIRRVTAFYILALLAGCEGSNTSDRDDQRSLPHESPKVVNTGLPAAVPVFAPTNSPAEPELPRYSAAPIRVCNATGTDRVQCVVQYNGVRGTEPFFAERNFECTVYSANSSSGSCPNDCATIRLQCMK
jgi:hypothetical protein